MDQIQRIRSSNAAKITSGATCEDHIYPGLLLQKADEPSDSIRIPSFHIKQNRLSLARNHNIGRLRGSLQTRFDQRIGDVNTFGVLGESVIRCDDDICPVAKAESCDFR